METGELISQGAEAKIYKINFMGDIHIKKERFIKKYRHPELEKKLTKERIKAEAKNMVKARSIGVNTPYIVYVDMPNKSIYMQFIDNSLKLKEYIEILRVDQEKNMIKLNNVIENISKLIATLHNNDIIHGDLTTSNILVSFISNPSELNIEQTEYDQLYFIDFGLSYQKNNIEDKAVDLYVLERAFLSTHPNMESIFEYFLNQYEKQSKGGDKIIAKLNEGLFFNLNNCQQVRMRGRKKLAFG